MILKGSKRGGAIQMAKHLFNVEENEHVTVHEVSGFVSNNVTGALNEIYGISRGTQCKRYMFSLSLNPPENESVPISVFEDTLARIEKKLKLEGQPRVVVFHEKNARRHAHAVWSRIDAQKMIAIDQDFFKNRLMEISKAVFLEQKWKLPDGFRDKNRKSPLNFTRLEWQQAQRIGRKPQDIKREIQEAWAVSDSRKSLETALHEIGYSLARGDRRGFVVIDLYGEVYSLGRATGIKQRDLQARLGSPDALPSVTETKAKNIQILGPVFDKYVKELQAQQSKEFLPLLRQKQNMTNEHRKQRRLLNIAQKECWQIEENNRSARVRHGFKGLWDKLSGKYWKVRKINEREASQYYQRDENQHDVLISRQLNERQSLETQLKHIQGKQKQEKQDLIRDLVHFSNYEQTLDKQQLEQQWLDELDRTTPDIGNDFEL